MEQLVGFEPTKVSPRFERWESNPSLASSPPAAFAISATTVGASRGNRTPAHCLEGSCTSLYTIPALCRTATNGTAWSLLDLHMSKRFHKLTPWSNMWDLNPRSSAWQADALPTKLILHMVLVAGLEPARILHRGIFLLLYVTIAALLRCSLDYVFTISFLT